MRRRSLLLLGPRRLEWVGEDLPAIQPDELLIQTIAGAISIGAELPQYVGTARSSAPARVPRMTGDESVGRVIACGAAVQRFVVGDRAVAFYGHRTLGVVSEARAIKVPDGMSDALALLAILTCDVAKGVRKLAPQYDQALLITGAGAIGLLTVFLLKALGVQAIDVVEPRPERHARALQLGARAVLSPEEMADGDERYPLGIECSSHQEGFALLQERMQPGGRLCILADGNLEPLVLLPAFHEKELLVVGSSDGWDYQAHAAWYFNVVREQAWSLEPLFEYSTSANGLIETFERLASGEISPIKVLISYT
jgi:alcohol dehydrogenase